MTYAQICHSQTGAEKSSPIANAMRIRMSNELVTPVYTSRVKSSPSCSAT